MDAQSLVHKKELEFLKFEYPFESVLNEFNANLYQYLKEHVTNDLGQLVTDNKVEEFNKIIAGKNAQEQLQVLKIGISSLNLFIQENWMGLFHFQFNFRHIQFEFIHSRELDRSSQRQTFQHSTRS
uniref:Uncharacterized protein n=1 Tax=Cacopsylla melanoneura TaxID=428564 RepID=A0A8D9EED6_9HEMI